MFRGANRLLVDSKNEDAARVAMLAGNAKLSIAIAAFKPEDIG